MSERRWTMSEIEQAWWNVDAIVGGEIGWEYVAGVLNALAKPQEDEFDEIAAHEAFNAWDVQCDFEATECDFIAGARWQFERMKK